jgi:hypothetical protein
MATRVLSQQTLDYIAHLARKYGCAADDVLYYRDGYSPPGFSIRVNDVTRLEAVTSYEHEHSVALPA